MTANTTPTPRPMTANTTPDATPATAPGTTVTAPATPTPPSPPADAWIDYALMDAYESRSFCGDD